MKAVLPAGRRGMASGVQLEHRHGFVQLRIVLCLVFLAQGLTLPLFPVRIVERGISIQQYGILQSVASLAVMFSQVQIGRCSGRLAHRGPVIIACLLTMAPAVWLFPRAHSMLFFGVLLVCHGTAFHALRSLTTTWVSQWAEPGKMGRMHAVFRTSGAIGWVVATVFLGYLLDRYAFGATFRLAAGVLSVTALFMAWTMGGIRRGPTMESQGSPEAQTPVEAVPSAGQVEAQSPAGSGVLGALDERFFWPMEIKLLVAASTLFTLAQTMGLNLDMLFFVRDLGVSNRQFGWLSSLQAWLEVPLMLVMGIISDRVDIVKLLLYGMVVGGLRWLLISLTTQAMWAYGIQLLHAVGVTVLEILVITLLARMVPIRHLGAVIGWRVAFANVAVFLAPTLAGAIGENYGLRYVFRLSAVLAWAAAAIVWMMSQRRTESSYGGRGG